MPHDIDPSIIERAAASADRLAAAFAAARFCPPPEFLSDDIGAVAEALDAAERRRTAAEAAMQSADTGEAADYAAFDAAEAEFRHADSDAAYLRRRRDELEFEAAWDELRDERRGYWRGAL